MGGLTPCQGIVDALLVPDKNERKRVMDIGEFKSVQLLRYESDRHFLTRLWHRGVVSSATFSASLIKGRNNANTLKVHRNVKAVPSRVNPRY
jgi:hypothetical protein